MESKEQIKQQIRDSYQAVAENEENCGCAPGTCCAPNDQTTSTYLSGKMGYSKQQMEAVPDGANLGLGCGNPQAIASLKEGETVLDLGSGAGFDAFLAAGAVGSNGKVIGVDMTAAMLNKARANAKKGNYKHVEFRLGEIEHLPLADNSVDVIISNCVINLSPDKPQVFKEAFRVLKSGGRLAVSDVVRLAEFTEEEKRDDKLYAACISGASSIDELKSIMEIAGFESIDIRSKADSKSLIEDWNMGAAITQKVISAQIMAIKP